MKTILALIFVSFNLFSQSSDELRTYFESAKPKTYFLKAIYHNRNYEPIFGKSGKFQFVASDIAAISSALRSHALNPNDYNVQRAIDLVKQGIPSDTNTELFLAENILKSAIDIYTGRVDPRKISEDIKYSPREFLNWSTFSSLNLQQMPMLFDQLAPKNKFYVSLRKILARLREVDSTKQWLPIEKPAVSVKVGQSNSSIALIKKKLNLIGYQLPNENLVYDKELDDALKSIQSDLSSPFENGLTANSKVWRVLNSDLTQRIHEVELQMEKSRWLPDELESRHAIANLANQMFYVYDTDLNPSEPIIEFRSIGGQLERKTPLMKDKIISVIFNPTWTMTLNIFFKDKLPIIIKDPTYLQRNGYKVISLKSDQEIDPNTINWPTVTRANLDFQLVQSPSYSNALGVVKFPMTNKYAIYLHDTGDRQLFKNNYRLLSSGCVRLEKPLDLAEYILANTSWNRPRMESILSTAEKKVDSETGVRLSKPLNIYILNLTVSLRGNKIQFFDDYYGQNNLLYKKLTAQGLLKN